MSYFDVIDSFTSKHSKSYFSIAKQSSGILPGKIKAVVTWINSLEGIGRILLALKWVQTS